MMAFKLVSKFKPAGDQGKAIAALLKGLKNGDRYQTLLGVTGSGKTFTVANIIEKTGVPALVIAPNKTLGAQLYQEYRSFFPQNKVCYFVSYYDYYQPEAYLPTSDIYIEKEAMINEEIDRLRHLATSALLTRRDVIVVASVSCIYNLGVPENYFASALRIELGQIIARGDLTRQLVRIGFERTNGLLKRGAFRLRGDTFEIMPAAEEIIYRVSLADQKIIEIAVADPLTRKTKENLSDLAVFPPKHFVTTAPERERAIKEIRKELAERLNYFGKRGLLLEAERLERRTKYDLEMIKNLGYCHGIENYSRHLTGKLPGEPPHSLLDYFPKGFLTIIDESHIAIPQIRGMFAGDRSRKEILAEHGWRLPSALDNRPLNFKEFEARIGQAIFTSATPGEFEKNHSERSIEQIIRPTGLVDPPLEIRPVFDAKRNRSQIDDVMEEIAGVVKKGGRVLITTMTKKMAEELTEFLLEKKFKARYLHSDVKTLERAEILNQFRRGEFDTLVGINLLREGLDLPEVSLVAILDADREGFLRSETSLIQTMGRAARNIDGRIVLYADELSGSLKRAIKECDRRRRIQTEHNRKRGIKPKSAERAIIDFKF
ncbi:MAG: excinuclease ABC subunit UvrB [Parcubacteria group bacterium]|nr:excinuclease ABC subunit UvrB [Parcubacteria group bacterium]